MLPFSFVIITQYSITECQNTSSKVGLEFRVLHYDVRYITLEITKRTFNFWLKKLFFALVDKNLLHLWHPSCICGWFMYFILLNWFITVIKPICNAFDGTEKEFMNFFLLYKMIPWSWRWHPYPIFLIKKLNPISSKICYKFRLRNFMIMIHPWRLHCTHCWDFIFDSVETSFLAKSNNIKALIPTKCGQLL